MRHRYALTIAYDGGHFLGFQTQIDGSTVQSTLEQALSTALRERITIQAAGRTDSGVHATGQLVSFRTTVIIDEVHSFLRSIDALAGPHIQVVAFHKVPYDFHPRFDCIARQYEYLLSFNRHSLFMSPYLWTVNDPVDHDLFAAELITLKGEHNFEAFTKKANPEENKKRYIDQIDIKQRTDPLSNQTITSVTIRGNAFLHNMIRIIIGTAIDRAAGRLQLSLVETLNRKDRTLAGKTAPANGLFFRAAYYPEIEDLQGIGLQLLSDYPIFGNSLYKQKLQQLQPHSPA